MRSWLRSMHAPGGNNTMGEPDEWQFDYPWEVVQTAFWLWSMSGFQRLPQQDEVMGYDPRYISDIKLAHMIFSHQGNTSAPMRLLEQWEQYQQNPLAYRARMEAEKAASEYDGKEEGVARKVSLGGSQFGAKNGASKMGRAPRSAGEME